MADALFSFELDGAPAVAGANAAANAIERLGEKIKEEQARLGAMQKGLRAMRGTGESGGEAFEKLRGQIDAQKASIASAQAQYVKFGGTFKKPIKPEIDPSNSIGKLPPQFDKLAQGAQKVKALFSSGAFLTVAAAAGYIALAAAVTKAYFALGQYSLAASNARRNEKLQLEGLTKTVNWWGIAAGKADHLQSTIDKVSGKVNLGRGEINEMARSLYKANLRGAAFENALEGVAIATAAAGREQGEMYKHMMLGGFRVKGGVKAISDEIRNRFGGTARAQMLALDTQFSKLRENLDLIMSVPIEPFLKGLHVVTSMFSQSEATGRALKAIVTAIFGGMGGEAEDAGLAVKRLFQGATIGALHFMIGVFKLRNYLRDTFGESKIFKGLKDGERWVRLGEKAVYGLGTVVVFTAGGFALLGYGIIKVHNGLSKLGTIADKFFGKNWREAGRDMVLGIIGGLSPGPLIKAMFRLGDAAITAFKQKLQMKSPSRVMIRAGHNITAGPMLAVKKDTPKFRSAVEKFAEQAPRAFAGQHEGSGSAGSSSATGPSPFAGAGATVTGPLVRIEQIVLPAGAKDPQAFADAIEDKLVPIFEGVLVRLGVT